MLDTIAASWMASIVWCFLFIPFFRFKAYYMGAVVVGAVIGGGLLLEYIPPFWLMADVLLVVIGLIRGRK